MSHGQATRSTCTFSRVTHFIACPSWDWDHPSLAAFKNPNLRLLRVTVRDGKIEPLRLGLVHRGSRAGRRHDPGYLSEFAAGSRFQHVDESCAAACEERPGPGFVEKVVDIVIDGNVGNPASGPIVEDQDGARPPAADVQAMAGLVEGHGVVGGKPPER